jgi:hypothetical protein
MGIANLPERLQPDYPLDSGDACPGMAESSRAEVEQHHSQRDPMGHVGQEIRHLEQFRNTGNPNGQQNNDGFKIAPG